MNADDILSHSKSSEEHLYTSTGIKFWRHREAMESYRNGTGHTVISTHISPEGTCNLRCPYCSVSNRKTSFRIEMDTIRDYVRKLKTRGLKAVILTGGGEPTLYPHFAELVTWLKEEQQLSVALISNGTRIGEVPQSIWDMFSWVRVSINRIPDYRERISFPEIQGVLGASMVYSGQSLEEMKEVAAFVPERVSYVRVLPNCLLPQGELLESHIALAEILEQLNEPRFFQQFKLHGQPCSPVCHQAYFRPYLSEVGGGTVFPCDSLVLNGGEMCFDTKWAICPAADVLDFLDGKIKMRFNAQSACDSCVFAGNIELLDQWVKDGVFHGDGCPGELLHEDFV